MSIYTNDEKFQNFLSEIRNLYNSKSNLGVSFWHVRSRARRFRKKTTGPEIFWNTRVRPVTPLSRNRSMAFSNVRSWRKCIVGSSRTHFGIWEVRVRRFAKKKSSHASHIASRLSLPHENISLVHFQQRPRIPQNHRTATFCESFSLEKCPDFDGFILRQRRSYGRRVRSIDRRQRERKKEWKRER